MDAQQPVVPNIQPITPMISQEKKEKSNAFLFLLIGITFVVLLGLVGFIVMMIVNTQNPNTSMQNNIAVTPTIYIQPSAIPTQISEEEEITNITVDDPSTDVDALQKDLNSL